MTEPPSRTWKRKAAVVAGWFVLMALLSAYQLWLIFGPRVVAWPPPLVALWLLAAYPGMIVTGLVLACARWLPGRTPMQRYWVSLCVGVISMAAMGLVLLHVWMHVKPAIVWLMQEPG